jgi:hypothetical protein
MYGVVWRIDLSQMPALLAWQSANNEATSPMAQKQVSVESASGEVGYPFVLWCYLARNLCFSRIS